MPGNICMACHPHPPYPPQTLYITSSHTALFLHRHHRVLLVLWRDSKVVRPAEGIGGWGERQRFSSHWWTCRKQEGTWRRKGQGCAQNSSVFPYGWASQDKSTISLSADIAMTPPIFAYEDLQQYGHRLASSGCRLRVWLNWMVVKLYFIFICPVTGDVEHLHMFASYLVFYF